MPCKFRMHCTTDVLVTTNDNRCTMEVAMVKQHERSLRKVWHYDIPYHRLTLRECREEFCAGTCSPVIFGATNGEVEGGECMECE